jgi:hypothetical protein
MHFDKLPAPEDISGHATVKILTPSGYKVAAQGDNGFVCLVMRGWAAPTFTPVQPRELVYYAKQSRREKMRSRSRRGHAVKGVPRWPAGA